MQATLEKNSSHGEIHAQIGNKLIQTSSNVSEQHLVSPNIFISQKRNLGKDSFGNDFRAKDYPG